MAKKTYSLYEVATGLFTGKRLHCEEDELLSLKLPMGTLAVEGAFDPSTHRFDAKSGKPARHGPNDEHKGHNWRAAVLAQIHTWESKQARAVREATLGDTQALKRLQDIDTAIAELRAELERLQAAQSR